MQKLSKKDYAKKKGKPGMDGHFEGKHWCDCMTKGFKHWLGLKRYGALVDQIREWQEDDQSTS